MLQPLQHKRHLLYHIMAACCRTNILHNSMAFEKTSFFLHVHNPSEMCQGIDTLEKMCTGHYGHRTSTLEPSSNLGTKCYGFQGLFQHMHLNFKEWWFGTYRIQYYLPNNTVSLVTIDNFDPNPVLVNMNKLKPYRFLDHNTLQRPLVKPSDMTAKVLVGNETPELLLVEKDISEHVFSKPLLMIPMMYISLKIMYPLAIIKKACLLLRTMYLLLIIKTTHPL